jgi:crotonobetainyl-CoA:carnitine CoA-transferase CaiB-like acyl-CoA transferase
VPVPVRLAGEVPPDPGPAPGPGQHTDDVLSALGYGPDEIRSLRTRGALR